MARTRITSATLSRDGVGDPAEVAGDVTNGNVITNTGITLIRVHNADATNPHTVTFVTFGAVDGQPIDDRTASIPANTTRWFGRFQPGVYGTSMGIGVDSAQIMLSVFEP